MAFLVIGALEMLLLWYAFVALNRVAHRDVIPMTALQWTMPGAWLGRWSSLWVPEVAHTVVFLGRTTRPDPGTSSQPAPSFAAAVIYQPPLTLLLLLLVLFAEHVSLSGRTVGSCTHLPAARATWPMMLHCADRPSASRLIAADRQYTY